MFCSRKATYGLKLQLKDDGKYACRKSVFLSLQTITHTCAFSSLYYTTLTSMTKENMTSQHETCLLITIQYHYCRQLSNFISIFNPPGCRKHVQSSIPTSESNFNNVNPCMTNLKMLLTLHASLVPYRTTVNTLTAAFSLLSITEITR